MSSDLEEKLKQYADLIVEAGLNLQPGQRLLIVAHSLDVAPLVRQAAASAYRGGCPLVSVKWHDEKLEKIRYQNAGRDSFEEFSAWEAEGAVKHIERGDAYLAIYGKNPELLKDEDPELVATAYKTNAKHYKPFADHIMKNSVQWTIVCPPTLDWATKVFPNEAPQDALNHLWEAVTKACRLDQPDPVQFWKQQVHHLGKRKNYLTEKQYTALQFTGPGTNLKVGLVDNHIWFGGSNKTSAGISFSPNIPTEEVCTMPHKDKVEGTVAATKPLSFGGNLIENFSLTFAEGKVVDFQAEKGEGTLRKLLETDEGANYLGEVALVPHKTPISELGTLFLNTLYDENASNHLALGKAYRDMIEGGEEMSDEAFAAAGGNDSLTHDDFMFG
ncbi:MAG: aminopeptidase, partial [Chloroflexota bacterium]